MAPAIRRLGKRLAIFILAWTPLRWREKRWIVWFLSPRFGIGVHAVITDDAGRVLSLLTTYSRRWQLPGGAVNYGETLEQAIRREVREELGLEAVRAELVEIHLDVPLRGVQAQFRVELAPGEVRLSEEHEDWRYAPVETLPPFYRHLAELVLVAPVSRDCRAP